MSAPIIPTYTKQTKPNIDYCIDSWPFESELRLHSPCSGLYGDGWAFGNGDYIGNGNAVIDPFYVNDQPSSV